MKDYMKIYREWLSNPYFDEDTKAELKAIEHDENEIKERFYRYLRNGVRYRRTARYYRRRY